MSASGVNGCLGEAAGVATVDGVALAREINQAFTVLLEESRYDPAIRERVASAFRAARDRLLAVGGHDLMAAREILMALGDPVGASESTRVEKELQESRSRLP